MKPPEVSLGLMTYNHERYLPQCIESLLGQTFKRFTLVISDDASEDASQKIALDFAKKDSRVKVHKNDRRLGMVANYRRAFRLASPHSKYFSWLSGHDCYHSEWLETLLSELKQDDDAVMAYPMTRRIDGNGEAIRDKSPLFDTQGLSLEQRIDAVAKNGVGFGDMIYGLFKVEGMEKAGPFPKCLRPDVLYLWKMCLYGTFVQVKKEMFFRRFASMELANPDLERFEVGMLAMQQQRKAATTSKSIFLDIPWYFAHTLYLYQQTFLHPPKDVRRQHAWKLMSERMLKIDRTMNHAKRKVTDLEKRISTIKKRIARTEKRMSKLKEENEKSKIAMEDKYARLKEKHDSTKKHAAELMKKKNDLAKKCVLKLKEENKKSKIAMEDKYARLKEKYDLTKKYAAELKGRR